MSARRPFGPALLSLLVASCATTDRRFPLRAPLVRDADLGAIALPCHPDPTPKEPHHVSCAPEARDAATIWDGGDNIFFRPLSDSLGVVVGRESANVNSIDEVPDSSWFTNRLGATPMSDAELAVGACTPKLLLDAASAKDGAWVIDKGKGIGSTSGFRVSVSGKGKYLFKLEGRDEPEHSSAASVIGATVYFAAGYNTTCEQIVYLRPSVLKLTPGLVSKGNFGESKPLDQKALGELLAQAPHRGELVRVQASAWLPGYPIGPFDYEGTRKDDPNDVIPHEDRRDLRGLRLLNAWIGRIDARSANTLDTWSAEASGAPEAAAGHVVHNHLDTSECLGSPWSWEPITRRLGFSYVVDWGDMAADFVTLGIPTRPWDVVQRKPGRELFWYFDVEHFVPDRWKMEYPNAAFSRMTERDGAWMARILARFTPERVHRLATKGMFSDPGDEAYLEGVLEGRLERVLERYLTRLSSITDVHLEGERLCGVDLAEWRGLRAPDRFRYTARLANGGWLAVTRRAGGEVCVSLPRIAGDAEPDDAPARYFRVLLSDGVAGGQLVAHLYDLGPTRGMRLVGLERPGP